MVIGFTPKDGHCAVYLLDGHYSYHLVGKRHLGEGYLAVGALINRRTETVRTADDERQITAGVHLLLEPIGILNGAELASVFV